MDNPELEQLTALGLLAVGSLAAFGIMIAGRRWRLSRGSKQINFGWADAPVPIPELPAPTTSQELGRLLESSGDWVHRRVESVEFIDVKTIRRRVSVDFTLPLPSNDPPLGHAPIALLRKEVLTRFDLRDEEGRSLPLLTASQNAGFATQYMLSLARRTNSGTASARLLELCWKIARADAQDGMVALAELKRDPTLAPLRSAALEIAARTFAENFMVIVPIEDTKKRRIIKFAYDELVNGEPSGLARFGLVAATFMIHLSDLGNAGSRHLEFLRADGVEIFDAAILGRTPAGESLGQGPTTHARTDEAHLFIAGAPRSTSGIAGVRLRPQREGILVGGPLLAGLIAAALTAAWFSLPDLIDESSGAASVLLAVPAALGAFFGTRNPHPYAQAMLTGARGMVIASGSCAFVAASALALDSSVEALRWIVGLVAILSWAALGGLVLIGSLARPRPTRTSRRALQ